MAERAVIPSSDELSRFLRRRLEDIGSTRRAFAQALGLSGRVVHRLLHGERGLRTDAEVARAARHLKIPERDLWAFLGPPDDAEALTTEQLVAKLRAMGAELEELYRRWRPPPEVRAPALAVQEPPPEHLRHPNGRAGSPIRPADDRDASGDRAASRRTG